MITKYLWQQKSIHYTVGLLVALYSAKYIFKYTKLINIRSNLQQNAQKAIYIKNQKDQKFCLKYRLEADKLFQRFFQTSQQNQQNKAIFEKIMKRDIKVTKQLIYEKKITVQELLLLHIFRHQFQLKHYPTLKYLADVCYQEAMDQAQQQQQKINENPDIIWQKGNELMGISIIVQDSFTTSQMLQTYGCQHLALNIPNQNSDIIRAIKQAGGIIFAKANVPQTGLSICQQLNNNVWGEAHHHREAFFSTGYQSGAVAALASSMLATGIGSDIDGSLRISGQINYIYAFKPTSSRVGRENMELQYQGNQWIRPSHGFLQSNVNSLIELTRVVFNHQVQDQKSYFDPFCSRIQFNDQKFNQNIKFGYFKKFSKAPPVISLLNTLDDAVNNLRQVQKMQVKEFKFDENLLEELKDCYFKILSQNYDQLRKQLLQNEVDLLDESFFQNIINYFFKILLKLLRYRDRTTETIFMIEGQQQSSSKQVFESISKVIKIRNQFCQALVEQDINVLLLPLGIYPLIKKGEEQEFYLNDVPSIMVNALDLPCGSLPIKKYQVEINQNYKKDSLLLQMLECNYATQGSYIQHGIQIVSLPNNDELCLSAMKFIEQFVQKMLLD